MGIILPKNFHGERYGLSFRFVNEEDAQFIVDLRTNPKLSKFLHKTEPDVNAQVEWIKKYKTREQLGIEYYFYFSKNGKPIGIIRISEIDERKATIGSWLCVPDGDPANSIATLLIARDILFETLHVPIDVFNVDKGNKQVIRLHKQMGAIIVGENVREYNFELSATDFFNKRNYFYNILNLK